MEGAVLLLLVAGAIAGLVALTRYLARAESAMEIAGKALGLRYHRGGLFRRSALRGSTEDLWIQVRRETRSTGKAARFVTVYDVDAATVVPPDLLLGSEGFFSSLAKVFVGEDVATGSPVFDEQVRVGGNPASALAALGAEARGLAEKQVGKGVHVKGGKLTFEESGLVTDADEMIAQVQGMIALARALACRGAIDESLERNAASDPEPGVRLRNLVALQERARGKVGAQRASETALGDADAVVRLAGAVFLGRAGVDAAVAVAETDGAADATRIGALRHVLAHAPPDRTLELARRLADTTTGEVRRAAVAVLGSAQDRASTVRLIRIAREDTEAPTLFAVAKALAEIGDPAAEPALVRLLAHDAPDVATAAARALAFVGSAGAVEPLRKCIGAPFVEPLRDTARDAIRAIQSRLVGAEAGQLSMSSTSGVEGELSLADDREAGRLSLPEKQRRREEESA